MPINRKTGIIVKGVSPIPIVGSFGGMILSGCFIGIPETVVLSRALVIMNIVYYFKPILDTVLDYRLKRKEQEYNHSITKAEANEHEKEMRQMELDHEYRMKQLDKKSDKDDGFSDSSVIPPADVTEKYPKFLNRF